MNDGGKLSDESFGLSDEDSDMVSSDDFEKSKGNEGKKLKKPDVTKKRMTPRKKRDDDDNDEREGKLSELSSNESESDSKDTVEEDKLSDGNKLEKKEVPLGKEGKREDEDDAIIEADVLEQEEVMPSDDSQGLGEGGKKGNGGGSRERKEQEISCRVCTFTI